MSFKRFFNISIVFFALLQLSIGQEVDKKLYRSLNPYERSAGYKKEFKLEADCFLQAYLNTKGYNYRLDSQCSCYNNMGSISELIEYLSSYEQLEFIEPYKEELWPYVKEENNYDFNDIKTVSGLGLFDSVNIFFESMRSAQPSIFGHVYARKTKDIRDYRITLKDLVDLQNSNDYHFYFNTAINTKDDPLSFDKLYNFAQEIIYINNPELNKLFWKVFSCEREIPVIFMSAWDRPRTYDTAMVSMAYIFGSALGYYHYDPLLFDLGENPYSVATVNGKPYDSNFYSDFKEIMEKYIYYVSGERVKIPFLIKFNKKPKNGGFEYTHYPIPPEYYTIPDKTTGYGVNDYPKNFSITFLKE